MYGNEDRGKRLSRCGIDDRPGMERAQPDLGGKLNDRFARGEIIAADQHIAIDLVVELFQVMRQYVLERRDNAHTVTEKSLNRSDCGTPSGQLHARHL
jgi:hypothetical protein